MAGPSVITVDGNEAAAAVAHRLSEVIAIYPITPSSPMGELADAWSAADRPNLWGEIPRVIEMQSEGGVAGALHGALQAGALCTTFTASQGLLLMIPNMYKIAGELTPAVIHIASRTVATHALSIFGDHSDVMAVRQTGWAMLASSDVQAAQDLAAIAHASTLASRVPFIHFFDGFRTSHEVNTIVPLDEAVLRTLIDDGLIRAHRDRALSPDHPVLRGSAQNPDVFFQAREAVSPFYADVPDVVQRTMDRFAELTGRSYHLFDYHGRPDAERVVVLMGSGEGAVREAVDALDQRGDKVGVLNVRLFRPFSIEALADALPPTAQAIGVLDRTKEPGAVGEPLYQDVVTALAQRAASGDGPMPRVIGGRYGLSSKEFDPAMAKAVFDELAKELPKPHFTVGIVDDVSHTSLDVDRSFVTEDDEVVRAVFFGLGADGTVSANKSSVKIIGEGTELNAQGYFVYDSKKSGSMTISHLRFGPRPIRSTYLIGTGQADFVACHQFGLLDRADVLDVAAPRGTFLLNSPFGPETVWEHLPFEVQQAIVDKGLRVFVVDAHAIASEAGLGPRVNTILQTCFFALADILPTEEAVAKIKAAVEKSYGKRGRSVVDRNFVAVDGALAGLQEVAVPTGISADRHRPAPVPEEAPDFVRRVTAMMIAGKGDLLPVSAMPVDGTFPTDTARWERRSIANEIPIWDPDICIDCAKCALVCPHAAIRMKVYEPIAADHAPATFQHKEWRDRDDPGKWMTIQVVPDDCTGCGVCVDVCPARSKEIAKHKAIDMAPKLEHLDAERTNFDFFLGIPPVDRRDVKVASIKGSQMLEPLFLSSGACAGCGETPYLKLLSQMLGDRILVANATGCSSIYGGNLPTTPWSVDAEARGPAWSNSLFEDNAEFGLGMRLALDHQLTYARSLLGRLGSSLDPELARAILDATQEDEAGIADQRERIARAEGAPRAGTRRTTPGTSPPSSTRSFERASGSSAATAGPTTSGSVGSITCWRAGRTSTCSCSIRRSTRTPEGRPRRPLLGAPWPSSPPPANRSGGRTSGCSPRDTATSTSRRSRSEPTMRRRSRRSPRPRPGAVPRCSSRTRRASLTASTCRPRCRIRPRPCGVASGRSGGTTRGRPSGGGHGMQLDSKAATIPLDAFQSKEARFAMLARSRPKEYAELQRLAQSDADERRRLYEQLAGVEREVPGRMRPSGASERTHTEETET